MKSVHIAQLLGDIDSSGRYYINDDIVGALKSLPKVIINDPNKVNVGKNYIEIQTADTNPIRFLLDGDKLFLRENVHEMSGLIAVTYLTEIGQGIPEMFSIYKNARMDEDTGLWYSEDDTLICHFGQAQEKVKGKQATRRVLNQRIQREHERLAKQVMRYTAKMPESEESKLLLGELEIMRDNARVLTRVGHRDFNSFQTDALKFLIDKYEMKDNPNITELVTRLGIMDSKLESYAQKLYKSESKIKVKGDQVEQDYRRLEFNQETNKRREQFEQIYNERSPMVANLQNSNVEAEQEIWTHLSEPVKNNRQETRVEQKLKTQEKAIINEQQVAVESENRMTQTTPQDIIERIN
ncbi:MAG: hypothetical protein FWE45_04660 [Firmicutes bacterium]|nr:hypothetical protein [Bacillota bacterium]